MPASATDLRNHIAVLLQASYKDWELDGICESFGMPPMTEPPAYNSKRVAVQQRLARVALPEMREIARRVYDELHDEALGRMIGDTVGVRGVDGELRNLIFATVGAKPRIVLRDAINNTIEIAEGADRCLVYDRALTPAGITRGELIDWWSETTGEVDRSAAERSLRERLAESLDSGPELTLARGYGKFTASRDDPEDVAAMIPQVYLHYDPYTARELRTVDGGKYLARQRMDFLLLLSNSRRVVLEVDGKQHYADGDQASPKRYSEMVAEDRRIRLDGYEVFRFGGYELTQVDAAEDNVAKFFAELLG
jgi:very-short-patch-repair endonuclease